MVNFMKFPEFLPEVISLSQIQQEGNRRKKAEAAFAEDKKAVKKGKMTKKISLQEFKVSSFEQKPTEAEGEEKCFSFGEIK